MSAPVEDRHNNAVDSVIMMNRPALADRLDSGAVTMLVEDLAQLLADTEAAERERSAALRAEFEACVRALRPLAAATDRTWWASNPDAVFLWKPTSNVPVDRAEGISVADARRAAVALSGPLAREVGDADREDR